MKFAAILLFFMACGPAAFAAGSGLYCATEGGKNQIPKLVVRAGGGHRLFICAVNAKKHKGKLELSGFRVFAKGKKGKKSDKPIFESDVSSKLHTVESKGGELRITELIPDGKVNVPAFETVIACDTKGCHSSAPAACVFQKPKPGSRRALQEIGDFQHGKKQGKIPGKKLIDTLAALAYSGDEDAQAIFIDRGSLSLDGEASEAYFDHQTMLERLKKAHCL